VNAEFGLEGVTRGRLESAITRALSGAKTFILRERENDLGEDNPYYFVIVLRPEQLTPEGNPARVEKNVLATKPAGLVMQVVVTTEEPLIFEGTLLIEEVSAEILTATYGQVT
jgi:hypothetical protein